VVPEDNNDRLRRPLGTVLVVDDALPERKLLRMMLHNANFEVEEAATGHEALARAKSKAHVAVVLDLGLPDLDGFEVLDQLVEADRAPVLIVSGRTDETDRVRGLELGASDYMVKPFYHSEFMARLRNIIRRARSRPDRPLSQLGPLRIDRARATLLCDERDVELTSKEFELFIVLAEGRGRVFDRSELLESVWQSNASWQTAATVTEHVYRLRSKLKAAGVDEACVRTRRGAGYSFNASVLLPPVPSELGHACEDRETCPDAERCPFSTGSNAGEPDVPVCVIDALEKLLRIESVEDVARWLQAAAVELGGRLVHPDDADSGALPLDLSLGEGRVVLATAPEASVALMQLERFLPRLVEDARAAAARLDHLRRRSDIDPAHPTRVTSLDEY
jgi:DNA-binding response OmpR family regulator